MSDRALTILIGAAIFLIVGGLLYRSLSEPDTGGMNQEQAVEVVETEKKTSRVIARVKDCSRVGQSTHLKGYVVNTGNTTLSLVTVEPIWKNSAGLVLARGLVYVVSREDPLGPGERREFEDVSTLTSVRKCNVEPLDWGI